jgi:hypothetical protein
VSGAIVFAEVPKIDSNFDGKTFKIEYDTNFDGNIDQVEHFLGDKTLVKVEFDADKNGEMDQVQHYSDQGKLEKFDANGKIKRTEIDENGNGKVDIW